MTDGLQPRRLLSYLIILAIAVVFALQFGPGSRGCDVRRSPTVVAATVNGKEIPLDDLRHVYNQRLMAIRAQLGGQDLDPGTLERLVSAERLLDGMVDYEVLCQAAEREGILSPDSEVREALHRDPNFQRNGKFDYGRYTDVLRQYLKKTPASYERDLRRDLSAQKLLHLVQAGAMVSEDEVKARFHREADRARLSFVRFLPAMYVEAVKAPPADVAAWEKGHTEQIAQEYRINQAAYRKAEQVRVRQVLLKLPAEVTPQQKVELRERLEKIRKEIEDGKDFAEAARQYSEDPGTKAAGGDLGFKSRDASGWAPAFQRVAFASAPGAVSEVVETPYGFHLLKVEEKKPAEDRPLDQVKDQIALQLFKREKSKALAEKEATAALAKIKAGKKLSDLFSPRDTVMSFATETKPEVVDTEAFSLAEGMIPKLGGSPPILDAVKQAQEPTLFPQLFSIGEGFALVELTERQRPTDAIYQAQKTQLFEEALQGKRMELQDAFIKAVKKSASVTTHASALATLGSNS